MCTGEVSVNTLDEEMREMLDAMKETSTPKDAKQSVPDLLFDSSLHHVSVDCRQLFSQIDNRCLDYPRESANPRENM